MIKRVITCTSIYVLLFHLAVCAQTVFNYNERCKKAYNLLFDLRFSEAQKILDAEKNLNPENGIPVYLDHYILFLKAFISEEEKDFLALKSHHDKAIEFLEKSKDPSPYCLFTKAEINLLTSFVRLKSSEYISGALEIRRAYKLLEENSEKFPAFIPNLKSIGLMHAFIGAVPENYKWLLKLAGMGGTIKQGISEMGSMYEQTKPTDSPYHFMHNEIAYVYLFSRQHLERNQASVLDEVGDLEKNNGPLNTFFVCNIYYNAGLNKNAIELLSRVKLAPDSYPFHYLTYMLGITKLNALDLTAFDQFKQYVTTYKGKSFVKAAWQKKAWIALINGDTLSYNSNLKNVLAVGNDFTDEDKQALKEAKGNEMPNVLLLKARLMFDGGYFKEALNILAGKSLENFPLLRHKLELTYRLGRIYDRLDLTKNAIALYEKTIQNGSKFSYYYAANSCLHLARIYENSNDNVNAEKYYKACLAMRDHEYQNSIDQKAKAGLNGLGKNTEEE